MWLKGVSPSPHAFELGRSLRKGQAGYDGRRDFKKAPSTRMRLVRTNANYGY